MAAGNSEDSRGSTTGNLFREIRSHVLSDERWEFESPEFENDGRRAAKDAIEPAFVFHRSMISAMTA